MGKPYIEHAGERFGRLTVLEYAGKEFKHGSWNRTWRCHCDCGAEVVVPWPDLKDASTRSCGCLQRESRGSWGGKAGHNRLVSGESAFRQLLTIYRKSARERGHTFTLTDEEFREIVLRPCHYCGTMPTRTFKGVRSTNGVFIANDIDRIDNQIGYEHGNVRSSCWTCNRAKAGMSEVEFLNWINRVHQHAQT